MIKNKVFSIQPLISQFQNEKKKHKKKIILISLIIILCILPIFINSFNFYRIFRSHEQKFHHVYFSNIFWILVMHIIFFFIIYILNYFITTYPTYSTIQQIFFLVRTNLSTLFPTANTTVGRWCQRNANLSHFDWPSRRRHRLRTSIEWRVRNVTYDVIGKRWCGGWLKQRNGGLKVRGSTTLKRHHRANVKRVKREEKRGKWG